MPKLVPGRPGNSSFENLKIKNQAFELVKPLKFSRTTFNTYMNSRNRNYILLNNNGTRVLGFAFVMNTLVGNNNVSLLATKPRMGYGSRIMNAIYNNAKSRGQKRVIVLNVVNNAFQFYKKKGYTRFLSGHNMYRIVSQNRKLASPKN